MTQTKMVVIMCPDCLRVQDAERLECYLCHRPVDASWKQIPALSVEQARPAWFRKHVQPLGLGL